MTRRNRDFGTTSKSARKAYSATTFTISLLALVALLGSFALSGQTRYRITGTYTNMYYNKEAGDLLGYEIKIVTVTDGYEGALQIAEGVPSKLMLVDIKSKDNHISFSIPDGDPYVGQFSGIIENNVLKGEFRFKSGGSEKVELKKGKSYWD